MSDDNRGITIDGEWKKICPDCSGAGEFPARLLWYPRIKVHGDWIIQREPCETCKGRGWLEASNE